MRAIVLQVKQATTVVGKAIGLIGQKPYPLLLKTRWGIHTFGMKEPIDILILDRNTIVRQLKVNLAPNRFFWWNPLFATVVELPKGTINTQRITIGSAIRLKFLV